MDSIYYGHSTLDTIRGPLVIFLKCGEEESALVLPAYLFEERQSLLRRVRLAIEVRAASIQLKKNCHLDLVWDQELVQKSESYYHDLCTALYPQADLSPPTLMELVSRQVLGTRPYYLAEILTRLLLTPEAEAVKRTYPRPPRWIRQVLGWEHWPISYKRQRLI